MIYIPILKTRAEELKVIKNLKDYFSNNIIPLIEVINDEYQTRYKTDDNGEYITERRNNRVYKVKCEPTENDVITLSAINDRIDSKLVFVDFFRFSLRKYGKDIDLNRAELSYNLNNDVELYKRRVVSVTQHTNMIPVISIKQGFDMSKSELTIFIKALQEKTDHIALRITEEWIDSFEEIIKELLRKSDFLLFDIEEQNPNTKFMELEKLQEYDMECNMILLNSPRKLNVRNGEYPEHGATDLIDNSAKEVANDYGFDGYGDYCGLKDTMPLNSASNGTGAALVLLYDYKNNEFISYCNHDTSKGMRGYEDLLPLVKAEEEIYNEDNDCPGYQKINELPGTGNWGSWHYINAVRYIHQVYKNMQIADV